MNVLLVFLLLSTLAPSPLPLPATQTSAFRGGPISLSVQLNSHTGTPIENATIFFFHETHNELLCKTLTNSTGFAQCNWVIPKNHELGPVLLNATFRGDPERYLLPSMVPIPLTIFAQLQTNFIVTDEKGVSVGSELQIGQRLFFHTLITDDKSDPLATISVQLIMEPNLIIAEKTTPENGSLLFNCIINQTAEPQIKFTIKSFDQGYYNGTEHSLQFLIRNSTIRFMGIPTFWHPSNGYSLQGKLIRSSGDGVPNASIELLDELGLVLKITQTEQDGHFGFDLFDIVDVIQKTQYLILRYEGTAVQSAAKSFIGIISSPAHNPFTQSIECIISLVWFPIVHQISIIAISCFAIVTSFLSLKLKRSTRRIVSH